MKILFGFHQIYFGSYIVFIIIMTNVASIMKNLKQESLKLFSALDKLSVPSRFKGFPPVTVDQTNFRISDIIKRNLAGEQVMGNNNLSYDYESTSQNPNYDDVNPFSDIGFDLDDVIRIARLNGQKVTDLQNRQGELKAALDKAKQEEISSAVSAAPVAPVAPVETTQTK